LFFTSIINSSWFSCVLKLFSDNLLFIKVVVDKLWFISYFICKKCELDNNIQTLGIIFVLLTFCLNAMYVTVYFWYIHTRVCHKWFDSLFLGSYTRFHIRGRLEGICR
jgi:hypothetical protein